MNLEWNDVHLFLSVVRAGSLRAAARELRIDVSTVSRRLTQLEAAAGAPLVKRSARKLEVTEAGHHVLTSGERVAGELGELARRIATTDRRLGGVVRITAPGSLLPIVSQALATLSAAHPLLELELLSLDALLSIDGSQVDVAIRIADAPPEHLVGVRASRVRAAVYAARGYLARQRAALDDPSHSWVEWDRRLAEKPAFRWIAQRFPERRIAARGLSTLDVHALIRAGVGLGALPRVVGDDDTSLRRVLELPDELGSSVWLLTHRELRTLPRIRVVLTALKRALHTVKERL